MSVKLLKKKILNLSKLIKSFICRQLHRPIVRNEEIKIVRNQDAFASLINDYDGSISGNTDKIIHHNVTKIVDSNVSSDNSFFDSLRDHDYFYTDYFTDNVTEGDSITDNQNISEICEGLADNLDDKSDTEGVCIARNQGTCEILEGTYFADNEDYKNVTEGVSNAKNQGICEISEGVYFADNQDDKNVTEGVSNAKNQGICEIPEGVYFADNQDDKNVTEGVSNAKNQGICEITEGVYFADNQNDKNVTEGISNAKNQGICEISEDDDYMQNQVDENVTKSINFPLSQEKSHLTKKLSVDQNKCNNSFIHHEIPNDPVGGSCTERDKISVIDENDDTCGDDEIDEYSCRVILDFEYVMNEMQKAYCDHAIVSNCPFQNWKNLKNKSRRYGLLTKLFFSCESCKFEATVWSEPRNDTSYMDINYAVVSATITVGIGHTQLKELLAGINIYCLSDSTYIKVKNELYHTFLTAANNNMKKAGEDAKRLAIERGHVSDTGVPYTAVVTYGSWMKRSFCTSYNSLSGMAVIIDVYTENVLFFSTRNKYCVTCARAYNKGMDPKKYICYKNWSTYDPSTAMESDIITEDFKCSIETHGLIYDTVVSDADSNVYKSIVDNNIYRDHNIVPKRILCTNHLLCNLCKKLTKVSKITQPKGYRIKGFV